MEGALDRENRVSWRRRGGNGPGCLGRADSSRSNQVVTGSVRGRASSPPRGRNTPSQGSAGPVRDSSPLAESAFAAPWRESVERTAEAGGTASTEPSTVAKDVARRVKARESSGSVGARAVGRLQKSVRGIFSASPAEPARATSTASGSTDRPLLVTVEPERFGRQGCWVNEREPEQ
jgi:hypothetical protein